MDQIGGVIRSRREALGLTLERLAQRVGCGKSYLSQIENGRRDRPPSEEMLTRIEGALGIEAGRLVHAARWQSLPEEVRGDLSAIERGRREARRLLEALRTEGLDGAHASGLLHRLVDSIDPGGGRHGLGNVALEALPMQAPLINSVSAGYPREFTDLGYPARVAAEYVSVPEISDPDAFAARVVGDSMAPEYAEGDVVVFSPERTPVSGSDCFVRLERDGETTFKRVYFERDGAGEEVIRIQPLNSAYAPRVLAREEVGGLYPAVCVIRAIRVASGADGAVAGRSVGGIGDERASAPRLAGR